MYVSTVLILAAVFIVASDAQRSDAGDRHHHREARFGLVQFRSWSDERKLVIVILASTTCGLLSIALVYYLFEAHFAGLIRRLIRVEPVKSFINPTDRAIPDWLILHYGRKTLSRLFLLSMGIALATLATLLYRHTFSLFRQILDRVSAPINLAIFRVVLFSNLLFPDIVVHTVFYSQIPAELRFLPAGLGWLFDYVPVDETWARTASVFYLIFCFTAMIGLFSRTSALLTTVLAIYVLGIGQIYGKVNHYHHFIWFAALLAASPCGAVFSCDAVLSAWKRADRGITAPPEASRSYAVPLVFAQLLLGIIYFFPGFWKIWLSGFEWALSDNLKLQLYSKWVEFPEWTPVFRLDQYPLLYKLAGMLTLAFELSFIFLIFFPRLYLLAPLGGIVFHQMTDMFMRIFFGLIDYYVVFFNWHAVLSRIGAWLYREEMRVVYDGSCRLCRRTIASMRVFDVFNRVIYLEAQDHQARALPGLSRMDAAALSQEMHAVVGTKAYRGFFAYRAMAFRIPVLWPLLPLFYVWPVPQLGSRWYRHIANIERRWRPVETEAPERRSSARPAIAVGLILVVGNIFYGITRQGNAWPLACYPAFSTLEREPEVKWLQTELVTSTGKTLPLGSPREELTTARWRGLTLQILASKDPVVQSQRLKALWKVWVKNDPNVQQASRIRFYESTLTTDPDRRMENPIHRKLLLELALN